jgi:hypothetical protein
LRETTAGLEYDVVNETAARIGVEARTQHAAMIVAKIASFGWLS